MTKKLAVFDLDGTLSRTELFSVPAAQEMERLLGYPRPGGFSYYRFLWHQL